MVKCYHATDSQYSHKSQSAQGYISENLPQKTKQLGSNLSVNTALGVWGCEAEIGRSLELTGLPDSLVKWMTSGFSEGRFKK